ncbi:anchored repeat-type ABC transporter permease subunit [Jonesia quinghaiensis]|uniref:anchored repeat-type ABC transporter permease subunit n=1 Tax=Jonesia quinghaiensis TaxID=262806 RepID=UPI001FE09B64|nr:anchored repeat-type ABC transporter permease subunit [Jonesia quinghaiensis]
MIVEFLQDVFTPEFAFLRRALLVAMMSGVVCAVVGTYVTLRGMAFMGDALAHSVLPGIAVAFILSGNMVFGGLVAGVLTAVLIAVVSMHPRLREDTVIGVLFVAMFALGVVIIARSPGYSGQISSLLLGSLAGVSPRDVWMTAATSVIILAIITLFHRGFVVVSLDRETAHALGLRVRWIDLVLYVLVSLAVVASIRSIGNVLVLALLITPAATARMITQRLSVMMVLAPFIAMFSAVSGVFISWTWDLPTGAAIVLVASALFAVTWLSTMSPLHRRSTQRPESSSPALQGTSHA